MKDNHRKPGRQSHAGRGRGKWKNRPPASVSDILTSSLASLGIAAKIREYRVKKNWAACVGEVIAKSSFPANLIGKTLYCAVSSSAWMTELNYRRADIIKRLNQTMGEEAVAEIVFRMGEIKPPAPKAAEAVKRVLSAAERAFIEKTVSGVKDLELREAIKKAMEEAQE